jgi:hypothetical protein
MPKWFGDVGYVITEEDPNRPGVFVEKLYPHRYCLEDVSRGIRNQDSQSINKNLTVTNQVSFIADPYAFEHYSAIRYVEYLGVKWEVSTVQVKRPRLIMTLGEVYNG